MYYDFYQDDFVSILFKAYHYGLNIVLMEF